MPLVPPRIRWLLGGVCIGLGLGGALSAGISRVALGPEVRLCALRDVQICDFKERCSRSLGGFLAGTPAKIRDNGAEVSVFVRFSASHALRLAISDGIFGACDAGRDSIDFDSWLFGHNRLREAHAPNFR